MNAKPPVIAPEAPPPVIIAPPWPRDPYHDEAPAGDKVPAEAGAAPEAVPPVGDAELAEAHRELLTDGAIQWDLPMFEPTPPAAPPGWLRALVEWIGADHPVLRVLLWGLLAAAVLLIVWLIVRRLSGASWRRAGGEEAKDERLVEESEARALLSEADALAARGLFSEAAHLLLFRSIEDVEARRPGLLRPALTSRDISGLPAIPQRPRSAFARIAAMVEKSLFGRRALAEADWRDCRAAYEEFAFVEGWRG